MVLEVTRGHNDCDSKGRWIMELNRCCNGTGSDRVMKRAGTVKSYQYCSNAGSPNSDGGEGGDGGAPHGYYGMRSSMHSDSITKLYAVLIPTATTSSEVREVSDNMHLDLTGRATMVGDRNPALS